MQCLKVNVKRQCELLVVTRSTIYYQPKAIENNDAIIMNEIREIYSKNSFFGYRKIQIELAKMGHFLNHKKVQRLMAAVGLKALYPTKKTTIRNPDHKIYPYLLRGMKIERVNQVWQVDITYIKTTHGFVYLVALIDVFSRKVMGWSVSIFLDTESCLQALEMALNFGTPEIINSDQGCQFTSEMWTIAVEKVGAKISMDGKGRWADNVFIERLWRSVKYENVFLHSFDTVAQAKNSLAGYIDFYNSKRPHQSLNYHTPDDIFNIKKIPTKQDLFKSLKLKNTLKTENFMILINR